MGVRFVDLVRGASVRGHAPRQLELESAIRFGRAFGTILRRRTSGGRQSVVVARAIAEGKTEDAASAAALRELRDGLVRGLIIAGHDVKDLGRAPSEVFTFALRHLGASGGVIVSPPDDEENVSILAFVGGRPLAGEGLLQLAQLADGDELCAGEGTLELVDVTHAFRTAPRPDDGGDA